MAANSHIRGVETLGKRLVNHIGRTPSLLRRALHASVYDKNLDEQVCPVVVPDEVIQSQSDNYWAPHPQTGVFGPATENNSAAGGERGFHFSPVNATKDSVLEQKAFFRTFENLEKPPY